MKRRPTDCWWGYYMDSSPRPYRAAWSLHKELNTAFPVLSHGVLRSHLPEAFHFSYTWGFFAWTEIGPWQGEIIFFLKVHMGIMASNYYKLYFHCMPQSILEAKG